VHVLVNCAIILINMHGVNNIKYVVISSELCAVVKTKFILAVSGQINM
jgi:hypothetical protein